MPTQISFHLDFGGDCANINLAGAAEVMSCNTGAFPANVPNVNLCDGTSVRRRFGASFPNSNWENL